MLRRLALVLAVGACCGMEMRETVERTVVVRTTGSDLQPAATGYVYRRKDDGEESVVEMGESEVMEHLAKYYEKPHEYESPPSAYSRYVGRDARGEDTKGDERVIPVKENEEAVDSQDDYKKVFEEYLSNYGDGAPDDDYLKGLERFRSKFHRSDGDSGEDDQQFKGYHFGKKDGKNYQNHKFERYSYSGTGDRAKGRDEENSKAKFYDRTHDRGRDKQGQRDADSERGDSNEHHRVYNNGEDKKQHEHFNGKLIKGSYHNFADEHKYHGPARKGPAHNLHESGRVGEEYKSGKRSEEGSGDKQRDSHSAEGAESSHEERADVGAKNGEAEGQSYGFEIKH